MPPSPESGVENILFVFTDQQRADSLGAYGAENPTPNLDRLAAEGTRYDRAYTRTAICSPSRASVLSGVPPYEHGIERNVEEDDRIADQFPCYPQLLRDADYDVSLSGKLHVGDRPEAFGMDGPHFPGWHQPLDHPAYHSYLEERDLPKPSTDRFEDVFPDDGAAFQSGAVDDRPTEASFTSYVTELALEQLEASVESSESPFYQSVHYFGPHNPYYLPAEYANLYDPADVELPESAVKETFDRKPWAHEVQYEESGLGDLAVADWKRVIAAYRGWVTFIDHEVGRLLDRLEELGVAENTAVVFTTDHGGFVTRHKLHDKGPAMYEDIYNVPFITRNLGGDGDVEDRFVSLLDLAPTFLDVADVAIPDVYEGESLLRIDDGDWREELLAEFHGHFFEYEQRMLRRGDYKLVLNDHDVPELYDLSEDPNELENRIADPQYGAVAQRLYERLVERLEEDDDPFPLDPKMKLSRTEDVGLGQFDADDRR